MSITCQICNTTFEHQITNSHLKTHSTTVHDYKLTYGKDSTTCPEYRARLSNMRKGSKNPNFGNTWTEDMRKELSSKKMGGIPWNKGKSVKPTSKMIEGIKRREERYKSGELKRKIKSCTEAERKKISKGVKAYAKENPSEIKRRAKKAIVTKRNNNYDFGANMRGKKHTKKSLDKIKKASVQSNIKRKEESFQRLLEQINNSNFILLNKNGINLELQCTKCHTYTTLTRQCFTDSKYHSNYCRTCNPIVSNTSKYEKELYDYISSIYNGKIIQNDRKLLNGREIDILLPELNIGIEFNGLYWHSEDILTHNDKSKTADYEKMISLIEKGYTYIGIFEDEWILTKDIVKRNLKNIIIKNNNNTSINDCVIKEISAATASKFCIKNHIQGYTKSKVKLGLFHNNILVSVMTFSNSKSNSNFWILNRVCYNENINVTEIKKLFKHFINVYKPATINLYTDRRLIIDPLYKVLGFSFVKNISPSYWYIPRGKVQRIHRYSLLKSKSESAMPEKELRKHQGYDIIWDCGSTLWSWQK